MNFKQEFEKTMDKTTTMALATSVNNKPNVRILNFVYIAEEKILFFQSKKGDQKEKEFIENNNVAFTTIPKDGLSYARVNNAVVRKSIRTIFDIKEKFAKKMPFYKNLIEENGNTMDLYELQFSKVMFFPDPDRFEEINLEI